MNILTSFRSCFGDKNTRQGGFTLIDSLIVIMILGILGMIMIPRFSTVIAETKLNEAAAELVSGLQYAGNLAVIHQRPFGIKADVAGNWFRVFDNQYKTDPAPHHDGDPPVDAYGVVLNTFDKKWYEMDFDTLGNYEGVAITTIPAGDEVHFYPDGHSGETDSIFVLSLTEEQRTIIIDGFTGRITVN